jgi:drug/metabolite transporter (DMT)-like permease
VSDRRTLVLGSLAATGAAAMYGVNAPVSVLAYDLGMTSIGLAMWRAGFSVVSLVVLLALVRAGGRGLRLHTLDRRSAVLLAGAGLAGAFLNLCLFSSFGIITVALALITFYTYPAMVALTGVLFHGERLTAPKVVALVLAIAGMGLVVVGQVDPAEGIRIDLAGLALAFAAALCQVVYFTIGRSGFRDLPADEATLGVFAISIPVYVVVGLMAGGLAAAASAPVGDPQLLGLVAITGILGAAIPSILLLTAIRSIGGVRTGILLLLEPVVGVALAAVVLGQSIVPIQVLGGALVLAGGVLLQAVPERDGGTVLVTDDEPAPTL